MSDLNETRQVVRDNFQRLRQETVEHLDNMSALAEEMDLHQADIDNPHATTKHDVDLGDMQNYPAASDEEAAEGDAHDRYLVANQLPLAYGSVALDGGTIPDIRTPGIVGPKGGQRSVNRFPVLEASPYGRILNQAGIVVPRKHREFQMSLATGNFDTPDFSFTQDTDTYTFTTILPVDTAYKWRCRDVDTGNVASEWSEVAEFATPEGEWQVPTIAKTGDVGVFEIQVSNVVLIPAGLFTHESTQIQVSLNDQFTDLILDYVEDSSLTSITVSTLPDEVDVWVRVRVSGGGLTYSDWSNVLSFNTGISEGSVFEISGAGDVVITDGDGPAIAGHAEGSPVYPYIAIRDEATGEVTASSRLVDELLVDHTFKKVISTDLGYVAIVAALADGVGKYIISYDNALNLRWSSEYVVNIDDIAASPDESSIVFTYLENGNLGVVSVESDTGDVVLSRIYGHGGTTTGHSSITRNPSTGHYLVFGQTTNVLDAVNVTGTSSIFVDTLAANLDPVDNIRFMTMSGATIADVVVVGNHPFVIVNRGNVADIGSVLNQSWFTLNSAGLEIKSAIAVDGISILCNGVIGDNATLVQVNVNGSTGVVGGIGWTRSLSGSDGLSSTLFERSGRFELAAKKTSAGTKNTLVFSVQVGASYDTIPSLTDLTFQIANVPLQAVARFIAQHLTAWSGWGWVTGNTVQRSTTPSNSQSNMPANTLLNEYMNPAWTKGTPAIPAYDAARDTGYLGTVSSSTLFTGTQLASAVGLTAGTAFNNEVDWLGFYVGPNATCNKEGGVPYLVYVPQRPHRYNLSWDRINAAGVARGDVKTVSKGGHTYKVRLLSGGNSTSEQTDPATNSDHPMHSEWNQLIYRTHQMIPNSSESFSGGPQVGDNWANFTDAGLGVNYQTSSNGSTSWCMEDWFENSAYRVSRGHNSVAGVGENTSSDVNTHFGWRSALVRLLD